MPALIWRSHRWRFVEKFHLIGNGQSVLQGRVWLTRFDGHIGAVRYKSHGYE
jgi:hypothetical protein